MEGHAELRTFDYIGKDPLTAPILKEMRNQDGTPRVCDRVWMSYSTGPYDGSANGEGLGKLTAGFGARGDRPTKMSGKIGPEFTFWNLCGEGAEGTHSDNQNRLGWQVAQHRISSAQCRALQAAQGHSG